MSSQDIILAITMLSGVGCVAALANALSSDDYLEDYHDDQQEDDDE